MSLLKFYSTLLGLLMLYSLDCFGTHNDSVGNPERQLNYFPEGDFFVSKNGHNRFTRAIYGTNTGFRFETSDFPELALYMPGWGGSMYMAVEAADTVCWLRDLESVESYFRGGERTYILKDKKLLLGGTINISMVALSDGEGVIVRTYGENVPSPVKLLCFYGSANGSRFGREGDLGADAKDCFFIKPSLCKDNMFELRDNSFLFFYKDRSARNQKKTIYGTFSSAVQLKTVDARCIDNLQRLVESQADDTPLLFAQYLVKGENYFMLKGHEESDSKRYEDLALTFQEGVDFRTKIADRINIVTPDSFINTLGGIFATVEDAIWESPSYLHGSIGWRTPLNGWRAAYIADLMGEHERARMHFDGYVNSQVVDVPISKPHLLDSAKHLARAAEEWGTPMFSNGYICRYPNRNDVMHYYDMNLVFIDELLWHLNWTGDLSYAKKIFPMLKRHLQWEKTVYDPDNDFLYDAYCCIWASDALQYNGGKVTHSSAYNYRANKMAAEIARKIGENPEPYEKEAKGILKAINTQLWIKDKGWWAEFKDNMGLQMLHEQAALWTVYHAIDSDIHDEFKAYQATRYVDEYIPHIPVRIAKDSDSTNYVVSTTSWQPYFWSINNVAFAEIMHTAYAYWLSRRPEQAFKLFKGTILDAMFLGSGPGNITQISYYDAGRGECYRDFADPAAVGLRAVVQGLFGIMPDLMNQRLVVRPGFPKSWNFASMKTLNFEYGFERVGNKETYTLIPKLKKQSNLVLEISAQCDKVSMVKVNGKKSSYRIASVGIGTPFLVIDAGISEKYTIEITFGGNRIDSSPVEYYVAKGDTLLLGKDCMTEIFDPQNVLQEEAFSKCKGKFNAVVVGKEGARTFFIKEKAGEMSYWKPCHLYIEKPIAIQNESNADKLVFSLKNNSLKDVSGVLLVNGHEMGKTDLTSGGMKRFVVEAPVATCGDNKISVRTAKENYDFRIRNWNIPVSEKKYFQTIDLNNFYNDRIVDIFEYEKYMSPRWPYTTLSVPTQGIGDWCHPDYIFKVDDSGLRKKISNGIFKMPCGIPFQIPESGEKKNMIFTTLWDNYPDSVTVPLSGKASKAYFLLAGSTYHMQYGVLNGIITVYYKDGSSDALELVLPETLQPLEQDIYIDGKAFKCDEPRPYRIRLKTGEVSKFHAGDLKLKMKNNPLYIDGGLLTMMDLSLDNKKELDRLVIRTMANEVIIGIMSMTLEC